MNLMKKEKNSMSCLSWTMWQEIRRAFQRYIYKNQYRAWSTYSRLRNVRTWRTNSEQKLNRHRIYFKYPWRITYYYNNIMILQATYVTVIWLVREWTRRKLSNEWEHRPRTSQRYIRRELLRNIRNSRYSSYTSNPARNNSVLISLCSCSPCNL